MRGPWTAVAAIAASLLLTCASGAQSVGPEQNCVAMRDADQAWVIKNCTAVVEGGQGTPKERAAIYRSRCYAHNQINETERAIADCREAIRLDPGLARAYLGLATAYAYKDDIERALASYDEALLISPNLVTGYIGRGEIYTRVNDFDRALADLSRAVALDPQSADVYQFRGEAYEGRGDTERALADYATAARLDPAYFAPHNARGLLFAKTGDFLQAIASFDAAIDRAPNLAKGYFNRGVTYLQAGVVSGALSDFNQALAVGPKDAYTRLWLDIAQTRARQPSTLALDTGKVDMSAWPAPVIRMYLGQMTPASLLLAADDPSPALKKVQVCEAYFYSGEWALRQGAKDEAIRLFRLAASGCPRTYTEWRAASAELKAAGVR
jgi:tetratricopeptide (TPR) repeat protein